MVGHDQSMLDKLISPSIMMLGSGEGNDIMSLNSMAGREEERYIKIIIREGWWRFIISMSQIEFEYFKET